MVLYILLIAHLLADFTFQSSKLAKMKLCNFKHLACHALIYASIIAIAFFPFITFKTSFLPYIIIISSHFVID